MALAARKRPDSLVRVADIDADLAHFIARDFVAMLHVDVTERPDATHGLSTHEEVARDRHQRDHSKILEDGGNAGIQGVARCGEIHWPAFDQKLAAGRANGTGEHLDQGGFTSTIVAKKTKYFSGRYRHRDAIECNDGAVMLDDVANVNDRGL